MNLRSLLFGAGEPGSALAHFGIFLLRVFTGLALALGHGLAKIPPSSGFVGGVEKMGFPAPSLFAWLCAGTEFVGGLLLAAGLMTRPVSGLIVINMAVAGFIRHGADPFRSKELAFFYGAAALYFVFVGSGRFGLDAVIRGK